MPGEIISRKGQEGSFPASVSEKLPLGTIGDTVISTIVHLKRKFVIFRCYQRGQLPPAQKMTKHGTRLYFIV